MKHLIEFPLEEGGSIMVEVDTPEKNSDLQLASTRDVVSKANQTFESALEKVKPVAASLISKFRGLSEKPDEISVEFGLKMTADAGAIIAAAGIEANYKITLTWKDEKSKK